MSDYRASDPYSHRSGGEPDYPRQVPFRAQSPAPQDRFFNPQDQSRVQQPIATWQPQSQRPFPQQPQHPHDPRFAQQPQYPPYAQYPQYPQYPFAGQMIPSHRSRSVALVLAILLGYLGIHRFYAGKIGTGIIWLLTGGCLGIGWLIDAIMIGTGTFLDGDQRPITNW